METQYQHVKQDAFVLKTKNENLLRELEQANAERTSTLEKLSADEKTKRIALENEIKKLNSECARLRSMRDGLQVKCDTLSASKQKSSKEQEILQQTINNQAEFASILLEDVKRLKAVIAAETTDDELYRSALFALDLELMKKNGKEMIVAEYETLVKSLQSELESLKTTSNPTDSDVHSQLAQLQSKLDRFYRLFPDVDSQKSIDDLVMKLDASKKSEMVICAELEQLVTSYNSLSDTQKRNLDLLSSKDAEIASLLQKLEAVAKENVNNQVIALQKAHQKQQKLIRKFEETELLFCVLGHLENNHKSILPS